MVFRGIIGSHPSKPVSCTEVRQRRRGSHQGTEPFPFPISPRSVCHGLFCILAMVQKGNIPGDITGNVVIFCYERKCSMTSLISSCFDASKMNAGGRKSYYLCATEQTFYAHQYRSPIHERKVSLRFLFCA